MGVQIGRRAALAVAVALAASTGLAQAEPRITDAAARDFLARQERLWNARDVSGFFATYAPGARIADQARTGDGKIVPYGESTVPEARTQARRFFARSRAQQTSQVLRIEIAPDGRSARTQVRQTSRIETGGRVRLVCGESAQTLTLAQGRILSQAQTDTVVRCPH